LAGSPADLLGDDLAIANPDTPTATSKLGVKAGTFHWYAVARSDSGKFYAVSDANPAPKVVSGTDVASALTAAGLAFALDTQPKLDTK
ncbi:MAG TPA: hypothetical protein VF885_09205, partial [Arthrobacter sp.]